MEAHQIAQLTWQQQGGIRMKQPSRAAADCQQPPYTAATCTCTNCCQTEYRQPCSCDEYTVNVRHSHICRKEGSARTDASLALTLSTKPLPTNHCYTVTHPSSHPPTQLDFKRTKPPDTQTKPQHMCLFDKTIVSTQQQLLGQLPRAAPCAGHRTPIQHSSSSAPTLTLPPAYKQPNSGCAVFWIAELASTCSSKREALLPGTA
jgi:hypothetical protein